MEKEFVPYEQALALKELGFDEPCFATIDQTYYLHINGTKKLPRGSMMYDTIDCPTFSQAFRLFREKYSYYAFLQPTSDLISENYCFKILDQYSGKFYSKSYKTYEEAELECLKKLIEIVKTK
jgi:hypothetical protein